MAVLRTRTKDNDIGLLSHINGRTPLDKAQAGLGSVATMEQSVPANMVKSGLKEQCKCGVG
jgi:hypothetical protein